jgi:hypothetical protein
MYSTLLVEVFLFHKIVLSKDDMHSISHLKAMSSIIGFPVPCDFSIFWQRVMINIIPLLKAMNNVIGIMKSSSNTNARVIFLQEFSIDRTINILPI